MTFSTCRRVCAATLAAAEDENLQEQQNELVAFLLFSLFLALPSKVAHLMKGSQEV